jgi:hypothetical protein
MQSESDPDYTSAEEEAEATVGQVVISVSPVCATTSMSNEKRKNRTLRLQGFIGKQEILILLDSESAGTFIS